MIPTRQLLESFCAALVVPEGPDPTVVTHYEFVPDGGDIDIFSNPPFTLRALNALYELVTTYSAATTFEYDQVSGLTISPAGWSGGELIVNCSPDEFNTYVVHAFQTDDPAIEGFMTLVVEP